MPVSAGIKGTKLQTSSDMGPAEIPKFCHLDEAGHNFIKAVLTQLQLSAWVYPDFEVGAHDCGFDGRRADSDRARSRGDTILAAKGGIKLTAPILLLPLPQSRPKSP